MNETWLACLDILGRMKRAFPFGGYPLHRNEDLCPFFIIGSGRSGTTLLRRILTTHPECHIPPETYVLPAVIREFRTLAHARWPTLVHLVLSRYEYHPQFEKMKTSLRELAPQLIDLPKEQRSLAVLVDRLYHALAQSSGCTCRIWGDKTPSNTYHADRIRRLYPNARFIHMLRDPCDVVSSMLIMGRYDTLEACAERWQVTVRISRELQRRHPQNVLEVRYEDLVSEPEAHVRRICDFLDLSYMHAMIGSEDAAATMGDVPAMQHHANVMKPITADGIGKGRQQFSAEQMRRMQAMLGEDLERMGYPPCA